MKDIVNNKLKAIIYLILYFSIMIIFSFKEVGKFLLKFLSKNFIIKYANFVIFIFLFIIAIVLFYKELKKDIKDFKDNLKFYFKQVLKHILLCYGFMIICNIFLALIHIGQSENNSLIFEMFKLSDLAMIIEVCLIGPIVEEIIYRGIILSLIKNNDKQKNYLAIIISALIFGFMHVQSYTITDILANIPVFALGGVIGHLYAKTDNLVCSSLNHITINTISTLLIFIVM